MTTSEFRKVIAKSKYSEWFNTASVTVEYSHTKFSQQLEGFSSIHKFVSNQLNGWEKYGSLPREFSESIKYYSDIKTSIEHFVNKYADKENIDPNQYWGEIRSKLTRIDRNHLIFNYESPITEFLVDIHKKFSHYFQGAYFYLVNNFDSFRPNDKNQLTGAFMGYEFEQKDHTELIIRRNKEKSSISKIRNDLRNQLSESEQQLVEHLKKAEEDYTEYTDIFDKLREEKKNLFTEWFETTKQEFSTFDDTSKKNISDLEKTYEELLRLKKPADYWNARAKVLKKEGWKAIYALIGLVVFTCTTLYLLLWLTPEGMLLSFIKGQASAIKWSVVYVTFISFLAYGIRALHKVAFSSFHLARDAEEREQLTYFYLSLIKDATVDKDDKKLIIQSLFSRADTGLLKDDSSPTMPNDIAGKIFGK